MLYATFTVDAFCKDAYFISWVVTPTSESDRFWQAFVADYPHKAADVELAVNFVKAIQFQEIDPSERALARLKQRIWNDIEPERGSTRPQPIQLGSIRSRTDFVRATPWYRHAYAAAVLLVALMGLGWWTYRADASPEYQTAYGKIQEIKLADGSQVTLNANSSLEVGDNLGSSPVREIWLKGEAYFSVAKRRGAKFIVHTPEADIEVLGTEFNVNTRREQTKVVLHTGKVQLTTVNQPSVVMKPGDMATVAPKRSQIQLKKVQPDLYEAWKVSYLVLDGKSLPEIIATLEDTFGVTIKLEDSQLANKQLTGKLRTEVVGDCIENLAIILDAEVEKTDDTYRFK